MKRIFNFLILLFVIGSFANESVPANDGVVENGIVKDVTAGLSVRFTAGDRNDEQSPFGLVSMFLYPTGLSSQLRVKLGIPMWTSDLLASETYDTKYPDVVASVEHEWAKRYFGIIVGLSYTRMFSTTGTFKHSDDDGYDYFYTKDEVDVDNVTAVYNSANPLNFILGIRGGTTKNGFHGRVSWPLPMYWQTKNPKNYMFEYSAIGSFGTDNIKIGIGVQGLLKSRDADTLIVRYVDNSVKKYNYNGDRDYNYYYSNYGNAYIPDSYGIITEYFAMLPLLKAAFCIGTHSVITFNIELGGIVFPHPTDWWAPNLGLDYVFTFGKFNNPETLDGIF